MTGVLIKGQRGVHVFKMLSRCASRTDKSPVHPPQGMQKPFGPFGVNH